MSKLKNLSGKDVVKILEIFSFTVAGQKGSHIKLSRETLGGKEILTVPNHKELDKGTTKALWSQSSRFISEDKLRKYFYTK